MKRTFSTMFVVIVVAVSATSTASARHWDGDGDAAVAQQQMTQQQIAPAKHHKKTSAKKTEKTDKNPYEAPSTYNGPH